MAVHAQAMARERRVAKTIISIFTFGAPEYWAPFFMKFTAPTPLQQTARRESRGPSVPDAGALSEPTLNGEGYSTKARAFTVAKRVFLRG